MPVVNTGGAAPTSPVNGRVPNPHAHLVESARDTLFTSGALTAYSAVLNKVEERPGSLYK
jgi:hypothetical protein